jgi:sulfonate transport system permease protein
MELRRSAVFRFGKPQSIKSAIVTITLFSIVLLGLWEFGDVNTYSFSQPSRIVAVLITDHARLIEAAAMTSRYVLTGLLVGGFLGFVAGLALGTISAVRTVAAFGVALPLSFPRTAAFLVIVGYFGVMSDKSVYAIAVYMTAALVGFMTFRATRSEIEAPTHPEVFDAAVMLHRTRWSVTKVYVLPMVLPKSFTAVMYVASTIWPFMIFAEPTGAPSVPGIGNYVYDMFQSGRWDHLFASALVVAFMGVMTTALLYIIQVAVMRRY